MKFPKSFDLALVGASLTLALPQNITPREWIERWALTAAPTNLARLDAYLAANDLNPAQIAFIDNTKKSVIELNFDAVPAIEADCAALFSDEECSKILTEGVAAGASGGGIAARAQNCKCATESDYCKTNYTCRLSHPACKTLSLQCGTLLWWDCNGLCQIWT